MPMTTKLSPIPKRRQAKAQPAKTSIADEPSDLSYIVEGLRALAVPVDQLQFDPANTRKHDELNLKAIRASLRVYGQRKPIVVNKRTGAVEAGNGTLQAALAEGWTHLAVVYVDDDPTTAAGFSIADNRTAELAEWDREALDAVLRTVQTEDQDLADMLTRLAEEEKIVPAEDAAGEGGAEDQAGALKDQFQILIICNSEEQQAELLERFATEGLECRSLIS